MNVVDATREDRRPTHQAEAPTVDVAVPSEDVLATSASAADVPQSRSVTGSCSEEGRPLGRDPHQTKSYRPLSLCYHKDWSFGCKSVADHRLAIGRVLLILSILFAESSTYKLLPRGTIPKYD